MNPEASPYLPPESSMDLESDHVKEIIPAGKWLRFANMIVDYIGYILFAVIVGIIFGLVFGEEGLAFIESIPDILLGLPIMITYYVLFEFLGGRTPGKYITGTRVVNEEGLKPTIWQVLGRTICRFIPFEAFSFFSANGRGWHDSIAKTYVIKCR